MRLPALFAIGGRTTRARCAVTGGDAPAADAVDIDDIDAQAILWHVHLRNAESTDRRALDSWLGEDPRHAAAFGAIRSGAVVTTGAANDATSGHGGTERHYGRWGAGGAAALSIVLLFAVGTVRRHDPYDIATPPGARRTVALDAGTRIMLNGGTRIRLDRANPRVATLLAGEALFEVRHDADRPFRVSVSGREIEDVGTIFDVVSDSGEVRVAVAEGSVLYNPDREKIALAAGHGLVDRTADDTIRLVALQPAAIGGWRRGQLLYTGQPLAQVAADLSRALGTRIAVAPSIAARPFSGGIALDEAGAPGTADAVRRLMPVLGLRAERTPDGWMMKPDRGVER